MSNRFLYEIDWTKPQQEGLLVPWQDPQGVEPLYVKV